MLDPAGQYRTPYKYPKPVLIGSGGEGAFDQMGVDIPFVFFHRGQYHMLYTGYDGTGYQSALAVSSDLLHWQHKGVILKRKKESTDWDRMGGAATWIIKKSDDLRDIPVLRKIEGKYWMVYHSYPGEGYEKGPAQIGLGWCTDEELLSWNFLPKPVLSWKDGDAWEAGGLYKACIIQNGGIWYLYYNAKDTKERWTEQTGVAISHDLLHWKRHPYNPILRVSEGGWDGRFVSDPCIVRDGAYWLNFYFGYGKVYEDGCAHAQEGLAFSKDLLTWEKMREPILCFGKPGAPDSGHAHKASVLMADQVLYHFYCGTRPWKEGDATQNSGEFRTICLAANKPVWEKEGV